MKKRIITALMCLAALAALTGCNPPDNDSSSQSTTRKVGGFVIYDEPADVGGFGGTVEVLGE